MIARITRLTESIIATMPTCVGVGHRKPSDKFSGFHSLHTHTASGTLLRVDYSTAPSEADISAVDVIIQSHDDADTNNEKIENVHIGVRAEVSAIVKASTHWASLTNPQKAQFQENIDEAALKVLTKLGIL